jgi:hypothetical protein
VTQYKLVIVPDETEVPGAIASTGLPNGTDTIDAVVHWCCHYGTGFEGGSQVLRFDLRRDT